MKTYTIELTGEEIISIRDSLFDTVERLSILKMEVPEQEGYFQAEIDDLDEIIEKFDAKVLGKQVEVGG